MKLYHHTCRDHGAPGIEARGLIIPQPGNFFPFPVTWVTDLEIPDARALGLTKNFIGCDRTAVTFEVEPPASDDVEIVRYVDIRRKIDPYWVALLEQAEGAMPMHWYLTNSPLRYSAVTYHKRGNHG